MSWKIILKQNPRTEGSQPEMAGQVEERLDSNYGKVYNKNGKTFYEAGMSNVEPTPVVELTQDLLNEIHQKDGYKMTQIVGSWGPSSEFTRFLEGKGLIPRA
jgi:hypothetical protein